MPGRQRTSWFGKRAPSPAEIAAAEQLTQAFFACERSLERLTPGITAVRETGSAPEVLAHWSALLQRYDAVLSVYLSLNQDEARRPDPTAAARCLAEFQALDAELQRFAHTHHAALSGAESLRSDAFVQQRRATEAADRAQTALRGAPSSIGSLSVVTEAGARLHRARANFDAAAGLHDRTRAAAPVIAAADRLTAVLAEAPGYAEKADRVLRSLSTRAAGIETRLTQLPATLSRLRREFSADCSRDLEGNEERIRQTMSVAEAELSAARTRGIAAPDEALALTESVRDRLDQAEAGLDEVVDRLHALEQVRRDPEAALAPIRFRVRDAQRFAVDHRLTAQWGSVLDAQGERLDRATALLGRIHPDYWRYLTELRAVDARVVDVIARMRQHVAR